MSLEESRSNVLIECSAVGLRFAERTVIEDFELTIRAGERIAFLGPSGCGKSTLLNLMSGLLQPTSGRVMRSVANEKISFVFQEPSLFPWKTVRGNLELMIPLVESSQEQKGEFQSRIDRVLQQVGLADRSETYPDELSGGMKMRVALARALVNEPQLLLLDEPFSALDDPTRERLHADLLMLHRAQSAAFVLVTHNIEEALLLCDRILIFSRHGRVLKELSMKGFIDQHILENPHSSPDIQRVRREICSLWIQMNEEKNQPGNHKESVK
jgi:NitT/TauT family transport system ATP-binding protein